MPPDFVPISLEQAASVGRRTVVCILIYSSPRPAHVFVDFNTIAGTKIRVKLISIGLQFLTSSAIEGWGDMAPDLLW